MTRPRKFKKLFREAFNQKNLKRLFELKNAFYWAVMAVGAYFTLNHTLEGAALIIAGLVGLIMSIITGDVADKLTATIINDGDKTRKAISDEGDKTRAAIYEDGDKTRAAIYEDGDKTREILSEILKVLKNLEQRI